MSRTRYSALSRCSVLLSFVAIIILAACMSQTRAAAEPSAAERAKKPANAAGTSLPTSGAATAPATPTVPPGSELHVTGKGETLPGLVHRYLPRTEYLTGSALESAIKQANPGIKGIFFKEGTNIVVPGMLPGDFKESSIALPKTFEVRAIYQTGTMAGSAKGLEMMRQWRKLGGNAVVFDVKDSDGLVNIPFQHELSNDKYVPIRNLAKLVHFIHSLDMHAIARIAIFRDEYLVQQHSELAVRSRRSGQAWRENGKLVWTDPSNPKIQEYNIALAKYAAQQGVDEIQFDYVRFPAEGDQKDAQFAFEKTHPSWQRSDVIADFLRQAHEQLKPMNVLFSLDVFGVMAWQRHIDLSHTGQDIPRMAQNCDVLSPMIYPSHFFGMDGYALPGDAPEHFIGESMERFKLITKDSGVVLRPWLQAFGWKTKTYSPEYIRTQVDVAHAKGGIGFLFWNARNDYSKPFTAMPEMKAATGKYFRGDELRDANTAPGNARAANTSGGHAASK